MNSESEREKAAAAMNSSLGSVYYFNLRHA